MGMTRDALEARHRHNLCCGVVIVEFFAALAGGWPFGWQWDSGWGDYRGPGDDCADSPREAWALEYQARSRLLTVTNGVADTRIPAGEYMALDAQSVAAIWSKS